MEADEPRRMAPPAHGPQPGRITVERPAQGVLLVALSGEHDLATKGALGEAFERAGARDHVLVDLSECSFIDSTVIGVLVAAFQTQTAHGRRLELVIPAGATAIRRVATVAGLTTFMATHETRSDGLAGL